MSPSDSQSPPPDHSTGLPFPRTWPTLYLLISLAFLTYVTLLTFLERYFR